MSEISNRPLQYSTQERIPFWRDGRVLGVLAQILFVLMLGTGISWFVSNIGNNLTQLGPAQFICLYGTNEQWAYRCAFDFLSAESQFDIAESVIEYSTKDSYWDAITVGLLNTAKVSVLGIILATLLGIITGIAQLSTNWLVRNIAKAYIDITRNTPLLLQLFFLYFVVLIIELPTVQNAIQPLGLPIYISQRGVNFPKLLPLSSFAIWVAFIVLGLIQAQYLWLYLGRREEKTGQASNRPLWGFFSFLFVVGIGWLIVGQTANNEGFLIARSERVRQFNELEALMERRLGISDIKFLDEALDRGTVTPEKVAEARLRVCSISNSPSEVNLTNQLEQSNIPYSVRRFDRSDLAIEAYGAEEKVCDLFVASKTILAAERDVLENGANHLLISLDEAPARLAKPTLEGFNFVGGSRMSLEFTALLLGLVLHTAAFIAEIVRAGILSVGRGQTEAARALGLSEGQRLQLIVLPQALRVIIPPLTSQYLNLVKNSSLALAVAYPDLWQVMTIIGNQSGRSTQPIILTAFTYLTASIAISLFLNWYNRRIQLVER